MKAFSEYDLVIVLNLAGLGNMIYTTDSCTIHNVECRICGEPNINETQLIPVILTINIFVVQDKSAVDKGSKTKQYILQSMYTATH